MSAASAEPGHQPRVGWFELFYDLVIVATIAYTGKAFAEDPTWSASAWIGVTVLIIVVLWLMTTLVNNLFPGDRLVLQLLALVQMLALVVGTLGTAAEYGLPTWMGFAGLSVAFATVAVMYALHVQGDRRGVAAPAMATAAAAAIVLGFGMLLPDDADWSVTGSASLLLFAGLAVGTVPLVTVVVGRLGRYGIDGEHLAERIGQLVLIVLGEAFLSLVGELTGLTEIPSPLFFVLTFVTVFAVGSVYFTSVVPAGLPSGAGRLRLWLLAHWVLMYAAVVTASGLASLTVEPEAVEEAAEVTRWTTVPLLGVVLAIALLTALGSGAARTRLLRVHLAVAGALAVLAVAGTTITSGGYTWEVAVGCLLVVGDAAFCIRLHRGSLSPAASPASGSGS